jgi:hypothetical protein
VVRRLALDHTGRLLRNLHFVTWVTSSVPTGIGGKRCYY